MCTGGDPGGGSDQSQPLNPPKVRKAPKGSGPAAAKQREVGVSYKPTSGISPGAVRAITGSDKAAANIAGRSDITKEQLGNLQTRATVGTPGLGRAGTIGGILNTIGTASAARLMNKLSSDTPTIGKLGDKPSYSVDPVTDPRTGAIVGVTEPGTFGGRVYSGRPDMNPFAPKQEKDDSPPPPPPAAPVEEPVVEVAQMGSGTTTKKRRGRSGRRTAFGTRQSLVNLRNV